MINSKLPTFDIYSLPGFTTGFYCETNLILKFSELDFNGHGLIVLQGAFKWSTALTGGTTYSVTTGALHNRIPERTPRIWTNKGNIYIDSNDGILKFVPSSNLAQYDSVFISLPFWY